MAKMTSLISSEYLKDYVRSVNDHRTRMGFDSIALSRSKMAKARYHIHAEGQDPRVTPALSNIEALGYLRGQYDLLALQDVLTAGGRADGSETESDTGEEDEEPMYL